MDKIYTEPEMGMIPFADLLALTTDGKATQHTFLHIWKNFGTQLFTHGYSKDDVEQKLFDEDEELYELLTRLIHEFCN